MPLFHIASANITANIWVFLSFCSIISKFLDRFAMFDKIRLILSNYFKHDDMFFYAVISSLLGFYFAGAGRLS